MFLPIAFLLLGGIPSHASPLPVIIENETMPLIIADLSSADRDDVENAAIHARVLGPLAVAAVPALRKLKGHPDRVIAYAAENALNSILHPTRNISDGYTTPPMPRDSSALTLTMKSPERAFEVGESVNVNGLLRQGGKARFLVPHCGAVVHFEQTGESAKRDGRLLPPANPARSSAVGGLCSEQRSMESESQVSVAGRLNDSLVLDRPGSFEIVLIATIQEVIDAAAKQPVQARAKFRIKIVAPDINRRSDLLKTFNDAPPSGNFAPNERARQLALLVDYRAIPAMIRTLDALVMDADFYSGFDRFCDRPRLLKGMLSAIDRFQLPRTATGARSIGEEMANAEIFACGASPDASAFHRARISAVRWEVELRRRMKARSIRPGLEDFSH